MTTIKPSTDLETLRRQLHKGEREKLRTSQARRRYLESLASIHAGDNLYVHISGDSAYCDIASADSEMGMTDRTVINVPAEAESQPVTDLQPAVWDLLFQKTELYHELGHVLYTDWPSFEDRLFDVPMRHRDQFKNWWNILEDAAIERLLKKRFNVAGDLEVKNENLLRDQSPPVRLGLGGAISIALMEYKHPLGRLDTLLDDDDYELAFRDSKVEEAFKDVALPAIRDIAPRVKQEGDPVERNRLVKELYDRLEDELLDMPERELAQWEDPIADPDDGGDGGDESEGKTVQMPPLSEGEKATIERQMDPDEDFGPDEDEPGGESGRVDLDARREHREEVQREREQPDEDPEAEAAEEWLRVIQTNWDEDDDVRLGLDQPDHTRATDPDPEAKAEAKRLAKPLERELGQRLQQERKTRKKSGQRWGKLDGKNLHKTQRGSTRVFSREVDPDEKDYDAIVLLDRSGSMSSHMIQEAEKAVGALTYALDGIGVNTCAMSFEGSTTYLDVPFESDPDARDEYLYSGYTGGSTPTDEALQLARERVEDRDSHPFVIIITDGEPDHREAYRDELHACNFPVLGIYIDKPEPSDEVRMNEMAYYDQLVTAHVDDTLDAARRLTKQVMF